MVNKLFDELAIVTLIILRFTMPIDSVMCNPLHLGILYIDT